MLTTHSYVLILGAGAGKPYGFPLGDELYWNISRNAVNLFLDETIRGLVKRFSEELRQTHGVSIDKYLNINKGLKDIGTLSVTAAIHSSEKESIPYLPFNNPSIEGDWYTYLYKRMIEGLDTREDLVRISENKVSFITFNYDRSLEHYIFTNLWGLLKNADVPKEKVAGKLAEIPIVHVYGKTGFLPWEKDAHDPIVPYGYEGKPVGEMAIETQKMINLIYDERENSLDLNRARELISKADRIIFLGFGYDKTNLSILGLPGLLQHKVVLGTAFNSTENERGQIEDKLGFGKLDGFSKIIDCDCLKLLREHLI